MKKKSIIALLLACSFAFGMAAFAGCNVADKDKDGQNQTDGTDKNDENKKPEDENKKPEDENKDPSGDEEKNPPATKVVKVSSITMSPASFIIDAGGTRKINVGVAPADATDKTVTWSSSNISIAIVDQTGMVTAKSAGDVQIIATAKDGSGVKGITNVTVNANKPNTGDESGQPVISERISYWYAGNECAAFEWAETNAKGSSVSVAYKLSTANAYSVLIGEDKNNLIRQIDANTARVDLVGLKGGEKYDFEITTSSGAKLKASGITISAYDRSGYAHFGKTGGVGAYKDDGTPKSNAVIVYVNEDNKNTVTANGKTGLINILKNATASKPLIVRVIGTVGSATWNELKYNGGKAFSDEDLVIGINGTKLPTSSTQLTQDYLLKNGYNTLNYTPNDPFYTARTPVNGKTCDVLSGIETTSKATYKSGEYDSCWNNVSLSGLENVTVEGIGEDARIFQWGFTWGSCNSIEVRNLTFDDYTEDACSFESGNFSNGDGYYWVHHNSFEQGKNYWDVCPEQDKHEGDGATDFKRVKNITIAYNHYHENHKTGLIGSDDSCLTANVTFHHNYYQTNSSRMPLGRQANMHMYNNYYYGSTGTNMSLRGNAFALIENCYFENANVPIELKSGGVAKVIGSVFTGKQPAANDSLHIDTNESTLKRETQVANNNTVVGSGKYFDVDTSLFYYDATNKKSKVSVMFTAAETKSYVPKLAGVQKHGGDVTLGGTGSGSGGTGTETTDPKPNPNPNPSGETQTITVINNFKAANSKETYTFAPGSSTAKYFDSTQIYLYTTDTSKLLTCTDTYVKIQAANKIKFTTTSQVPAGAKLVLTMDSSNQATAVKINDVNVDIVDGKVTFDLASGTEYILGRAGGETRIASISIVIPA